MKVLFIDNQPLYEDLLPAGLRQIGCTVETATEVWDGALDRAIAAFQPDFALMMGWSNFPTVERRAVIREALDRHQVPLVYWATEDPCWFEAWSLPVVQSTRPALVATICAEYVRRYEAEGIRAVPLTFGYNPEVYRSVAPRPEYACDLAVVANFYYQEFDRLNRKRSLLDLVKPVLERGYDLKIWGVDWNLAPQHGLPLRDGIWQGWLNYREASAAYNSAKIVLGLQNEFDFATNLTMRTCEVMGSGGFLLASRTKATAGMFQHRRHLTLSGSPQQTLALVDYYLNHPDERAEIAGAGQAEVRARFTYAHRAEELLYHVKRLIPPGGRGMRK